MPNKLSIEAPISLIGSGRSGSTLLTNVFRQHPDFQSLGETANLIFSPYYYVLKALPFCGPRPYRTTVEEAAKIAIHSMLIRTYHSKMPHWFHKPILLPTVVREFDTVDAFASWYWNATRELFPKGKFFTVLRSPERVIISSMTRWGHAGKRAADNLARLYRVMLHPDSRLEFGIDFDELVHSPERTVRELFAFAGVEYNDACMSAFERQHASNDKSAVALVEQRLADTPLTIPQEVHDLYGTLMKKFTGNPRPAAVAGTNGDRQGAPSGLAPPQSE